MRIALISSLALVVACSGAAEPAAQPPVVVPSAAPIATTPTVVAPDAEGAKRIKSDVTYLASPALEGRGTGTPGATLARDFVAKRFADLGLEPFGDKDASGKATYFQAFKAKVGAKSEEPLVDFHLDTHVATMSTWPPALAQSEGVVADGSASADTGGDVVFAGYGITAAAVPWDDYAKLDVEKKIVVLLRGAPEKRELRDFGGLRYKLRTAREHGAAGVVFIGGDDLPKASEDASSMGIPGVVLSKSAAAPLLKLMKLDAKAIAAATPVKPKKDVWLSVKTKVSAVEADAWNVVGLLRADKSDEYVVVGAHYDHLGHGGTSASRAPESHEVHPGADDNASGTALVMEVARTLTKQPARPDRNVIFIGFSGEELGVLGSRFFVDHAPVAIDKIDAMINADMVGRLRENKLLVDGIGTSVAWTDLVKKADDGLGLDLSFGNEPFGASDHASFAGARIPVAFFFTGVHDDYHRPSDTADKINAEGEEKIATMAARLALEVASKKDKLAFVDAPADPHHGMSGGFKVSLGTMPDYAFQGPGLRLTGVRADSPAQHGGLQGGDTIMKVGPHLIGNIHDYMFALGDLEPGREVAIEVERGGKKMTLKVVPAPGR